MWLLWWRQLGALLLYKDAATFSIWWVTRKILKKKRQQGHDGDLTSNVLHCHVAMVTGFFSPHNIVLLDAFLVFN